MPHFDEQRLGGGLGANSAVCCARARFSKWTERILIRIADTKVVAQHLHARYEPLRAVTLIGRTMQKALFAGRSDEVVFWALVHAHYRGGELCGATEAELAAFRASIVPDLVDLH